jgi:hypothetical protein
MKAQPNEIDSLVLGRIVLDLTGIGGDADFAEFEAAYRREHDPYCAVSKVAAEELATIHKLEGHGFRFVEFQIRLMGKITRSYDTSRYPYRMERVTSEADLEPVLAIAGTTFEHDRFSLDPVFGAAGRNVSGERYRRYVLKSFQAADECVYRLVSEATGETTGFGTHRHLGGGDALLLIGGVRTDLKHTGLGAINDYFGWNELKREGVTRFYTHVSGVNYPIMNLEIRGLKFHVVQSHAVLRKIYE